MKGLNWYSEVYRKILLCVTNETKDLFYFKADANMTIWLE